MFFGSQATDPLHRLEFRGLPFFPTFVCKDKLVASVNLAKIMNEQHGDHAVNIDLQLQCRPWT